MMSSAATAAGAAASAAEDVVGGEQDSGTPLHELVSKKLGQAVVEVSNLNKSYSLGDSNNQVLVLKDVSLQWGSEFYPVLKGVGPDWWGGGFESVLLLPSSCTFLRGQGGPVLISAPLCRRSPHLKCRRRSSL